MSARVRRDPRADKEGRRVDGGARVRFRIDPAPAPPGRRRDPRAQWLGARVPGTLRTRFDLRELGRAPLVAPLATETAAPKAIRVRVVEAPAFLVAAVVEAAGGRLSAEDRQALGAARILADAGGGAVVLLAQKVPEDAGAAGADRVAVLPAAQAPDAAAAGVAAAITALAPRHVVWPETADAGDGARRVAVLLSEPLFAAAEQVTARSVLRAARGRSVEQRAGVPRLVTVADGAVAPHAREVHEARPLALATEQVATAFLASEEFAADPATVALAEADFVVSAGNGVSDFDGFRALVAALGATPGASRMVCDAGLMPRAAQVGASGTVLGARCYLALGIAGAPQHLEGVARCETVIAINTDLHAAMVARADLAIVADAQKVVPALIALCGAGAGSGGARALPTIGGRARTCVLLSEGRHPASGRAVLAEAERRAVGLAATLDPCPAGIFAGPEADAVREALGRGLAGIDHRVLPGNADPVDAIVAAVRAAAPELVLAGMRAEGSDGSGLAPYLVADALGWPIVAGAVAVRVADGVATVLQALPRGARRVAQVRLPALVTVHRGAPAPPPFASAQARRRPVVAQPATGRVAEPMEERPYRRRPKAAAVAGGGSASERLAQASGAASAGGVLMVDPRPEEAARAVLAFLRRNGLFAG